MAVIANAGIAAPGTMPNIRKHAGRRGKPDGPQQLADIGVGLGLRHDPYADLTREQRHQQTQAISDTALMKTML